MTSTITATKITKTDSEELMDAIAKSHWRDKLNLPKTDLAKSALTGTGEKIGEMVGTAIDTLSSTKEFVRPNGETYFARPMEIGTIKTHDVALLATAYEDRTPVLLHGPPGTGKTALIEAAMPTVVTVQGTVETERPDFEGSWTQNPDGTYAWIDGPLIIAMEEGRPLFIDEIALIDPRVMATVYGTMDGRGELVVTANPKRGVVKAKDGFAIYGACNPNVPGALMSDALLSRFQIHIEVLTDWKLAKKMGVSRELIEVCKLLNNKYESGEITAPPQMREMLTFLKVEARYGLDFAMQNFVGQSRETDRAIVSTVVAEKFKLSGTRTRLTSLRIGS